MSTALDGAVELLDRSLAYTRVALGDVADPLLARPTPCAAWTLGDLLAHMDDALDAFTEAAGGLVEVDPPAPASTRLGELQAKACALLGAWTRATPARVTVGDSHLGSPLLVATAALEVTVHGWDVGQATGRRAPIPEDLARALLEVAHRVVEPTDRGVRFGLARPAPADAASDVRLLAFLGRQPVGPGRLRISGATGPGLAS